MSSSRFARSLRNVFKTSWKMKSCYTEDVLKTSSRRHEDQQMFAGLWLYLTLGTAMVPYVYLNHEHACMLFPLLTIHPANSAYSILFIKCFIPLRPKKCVYMLKKNRVGRYVGFLIFFFLVIFFSIQRGCWTLKQNLVKFKYTPSLTSLTKKLNHLI